MPGGPWRQFLAARDVMLDAYDRAATAAAADVVHTHHGFVAEAATRNWLSSFLPRRYGVTAGKIRSQGLPSGHLTNNFDVIVYDQIESPVLWIEDNADKSEAGRTRIIPAEHVRLVLEVKASLTKSSMNDALSKLSELEPLTNKIDPPGELYPKFLSSTAAMAMIFFECRKSQAHALDVLNMIRDFAPQRFSPGAMVLRGEGRPPDESALLHAVRSDTDIPTMGQSLLDQVVVGPMVPWEGEFRGAMHMWYDIHFSTFAFDLLALANGTYRPGRTSSFHGFEFTEAGKANE